MFTTQKQNQTQKNDTDQESIYIHTMRDDLNGMPSTETSVSLSENPSDTLKPASNQQVSQNFTSSPFSASQTQQQSPQFQQTPQQSSPQPQQAIQPQSSHPQQSSLSQGPLSQKIPQPKNSQPHQNTFTQSPQSQQASQPQQTSYSKQDFQSLKNEQPKSTSIPPQPTKPEEKPKSKEAPKETIIQATSKQPHSVNWGLILFAIVGLLIALSVVALGYYFLVVNKKPTETQQLPPIEVPQNIPEEPVTIKPENQKYSIESPNYFPIDTESTSADDIRKSFIQTKDQIKQLKTQKPIEFIVTDTNNNPIAFPIFATTAKIKLSPELLSNFEEGFSVYYFIDNDKVRLGLSVNVKNKEVVSSLMAKEEKALVDELSFLFLGEIPAKKDASFNTGSYKDHSIRYMNLDEQESLSIDYVLADTKLVIGTSKNTTRAILDVISPTTSTQSGATAPQLSPNTSTSAFTRAQ